jgi:hypothetical protein
MPQALQLLQMPLTSISTWSAENPLGSFMEGIVTSSRHTVFPHELQMKCTWSSR